MTMDCTRKLDNWQQEDVKNGGGLHIFFTTSGGGHLGLNSRHAKLVCILSSRKISSLLNGRTGVKPHLLRQKIEANDPLKNPQLRTQRDTAQK